MIQRHWRRGQRLTAGQYAEVADAADRFTRLKARPPLYVEHRPSGAVIGMRKPRQLHRAKAAEAKDAEPATVFAVVISDAALVEHTRYVPVVRMYWFGQQLFPYPNDNVPNGPYTLALAYPGSQWSSYSRRTRPIQSILFDHNVGFPTYLRPLFIVGNPGLPQSVIDVRPGAEVDRFYLIDRP